MRKVLILILIAVSACNSKTDLRQKTESVRLLSFDEFIKSPDPDKKRMDIFEGGRIRGTVISVGKPFQKYIVLPDDELMIYAIKGGVTIEVPQGNYEIKAGEAVYLPSRVAFRLSSPTEGPESKVLFVRSNHGAEQEIEAETR